MGNSGSKKKYHRIVFLGLDNSGKSVLVRRLIKLTDHSEVSSSTTSSVYEAKFRGMHFKLWDIPGMEQLRPLWVHQINNLSLLCYIIDISDEDRFPEALTELRKLNENYQTKGIPFLIVGNKSDISTNVTFESLSEKFMLDRPANLIAYDLISGLNDSNFNSFFESINSLITGIPKKQEKSKKSLSKSPKMESEENPIDSKRTEKKESQEEPPSAQPEKKESKEEPPSIQPEKEESKEEPPSTQPEKEESQEEPPSTQPEKAEEKTSEKSSENDEPPTNEDSDHMSENASDKNSVNKENPLDENSINKSDEDSEDKEEEEEEKSNPSTPKEESGESKDETNVNKSDSNLP